MGRMESRMSGMKGRCGGGGVMLNLFVPEQAGFISRLFITAASPRLLTCKVTPGRSEIECGDLDLGTRLWGHVPRKYAVSGVAGVPIGAPALGTLLYPRVGRRHCTNSFGVHV